MSDFLSAAPPLPAHIPHLTDREHTILALIAEGCTNQEIGIKLFITTDTVKTNNRRIFRKLGVESREHAVAQAFRAGLLR